MSIVTLWLPNGHIKVPVVTDYTESGIHYVELNIPLPFQRNLRDDLLLLIADEDRADHDNNNRNVYLRSPYGTGPYCWTGKLRTEKPPITQPADVVVCEEVTDELQPEIPKEIPVVTKPDTIGGDSWFDLDDDITADLPWSAVEEYLKSQE